MPPTIVLKIRHSEKPPCEVSGEDGTYEGTNPSNPGTICFAKGTLIETKCGLRLVEDLRVDDAVFTGDNAYQQITCIGTAQRSRLQTARNENIRPVIVRKDAFGVGCPSHDLTLSPQHRLLSTGLNNHLLFGVAETLVAAKYMMDNTRVVSAGACDVTYYHLMFNAHQIVCSNGLWAESFLPGDYALSTLSAAARAEFEALFPHFLDEAVRDAYAPARYVLKKHEAGALQS